jgi:hypothetical protein
MSPLSAGSGPSGCSSVFSGVFIAEEVDGVGNKGSGDTTAVDVQTLLEVLVLELLSSSAGLSEFPSHRTY